MSGPLAVFYVDQSSDTAITGVRVFDRANGGTLVGPGGDTLPTPGAGTTTANEWFFKTGTSSGLYRMNDDNDTWEFIAGVVATAWGAIGGTLGDQTDLQSALNAKAAAGDLSSHTGNTSNPHSTSIANIGSGTLSQLNTAITDATLDDSSSPRTPSSHTHGNITNSGLIGTTANLPLITGTAGIIQASSFGSSVNTFCQGNDSRLSDARIPIAHAFIDTTGHTATGLTTGHFLKATGATTYGFAAHGLTYSDVGAAPSSTVSFPGFGTTNITACVGDDGRLSDARTPVSHVHGNITNIGAIGTTANLPLITGTSGVIQASSFGTTTNTFCQGNDSRLSDSRTPTSHSSSHEVGGSDLISHDSITGAGTNSHSTIDSHLSSTSNPHSVTLEQARSAGSALSGNINMNGNDLTSLRKVGFGTVQSVNASSGAAAVAFGTYQKFNVNLNDEPEVIVTLGTPFAPGNYVLTLIHGSTTASAVTFATEGSEVIYAQGGAIDVDGSTGNHYVVTGYFNGTNWYLAASNAMSTL